MPAREKLRAYLSGGMEFAKGEGVGWRQELEAWIEGTLNHSVYNPNRESEAFLSKRLRTGNFRELKKQDFARYVDLVRELIDMDCREIAERSDYVVCYWDESAQRGAGTKGELTIARFVGKPVYIVTSLNVETIPGWVLGCATEIFESFQTLRSHLERKYAD